MECVFFSTTVPEVNNIVVFLAELSSNCLGCFWIEAQAMKCSPGNSLELALLNGVSENGNGRRSFVSDGQIRPAVPIQVTN